jgi:CheY-like chemotaxis protein
MPCILAIESDPKRKRLLADLVREHVKAELKIASNVANAIALLEQQLPDLILAPALLSPADGATLMAHVKQLHAAPYLQLVTIPAFDMLAEPQEEAPRRLFGPLRGRRSEPMPKYDRAMVGAQIADGVARAQEARQEYEAMVAFRAELEAEAKRRGETLPALIRPFDGAMARQAGVEDLVIEMVAHNERTGDDRRTALRRAQQDLPWLSGVALGWGTDVSLVNISTSGVLMETGSKFAPGSTTELHLKGPETNLVVPVRFVRTDIARIDNLGVKYHAAARFDREIDLDRGGPRRAGHPSKPPQALAQLLVSALAAEGRRAEPAHAAFVRGVRELVGARDVQLRTAPIGSPGGRETLYFDVPGDDRARRTLQVVFDRHHNVTDDEFRLLKAAAWMTAAAFELGASEPAQAQTSGGMKLLQEAVA